LADAVIGREAEVAATTAMLEAVPSGPIALPLEGEVGIAKTTLVRAAVADAAAPPALRHDAAHTFNTTHAVRW
jgi:MoxR-like ATPase